MCLVISPYSYLMWKLKPGAVCPAPPPNPLFCPFTEKETEAHHTSSSLPTQQPQKRLLLIHLLFLRPASPSYWEDPGDLRPLGPLLSLPWASGTLACRSAPGQGSEVERHPARPQERHLPSLHVGVHPKIPQKEWPLLPRLHTS